MKLMLQRKKFKLSVFALMIILAVMMACPGAVMGDEQSETQEGDPSSSQTQESSSGESEQGDPGASPGELEQWYGPDAAGNMGEGVTGSEGYPDGYMGPEGGEGAPEGQEMIVIGEDGRVTEIPAQGSHGLTPANEPEALVGNTVSKNASVFRCHRPEEYDNVFVGDSRTVAIYMLTRRGKCNSAFICEEGMGYGWLASDKVNQYIRDYARPEKNVNLIINMGINDTTNLASYARFLNKKAQQWRDMGYKLYYVSVNPVGEGRNITNTEVDEFNCELESSLKDYYWIDTNSYLKKTGFSSNDGLHYDSDTTIRIYDHVLMEAD